MIFPQIFSENKCHKLLVSKQCVFVDSIIIVKHNQGYFCNPGSIKPWLTAVFLRGHSRSSYDKHDTVGELEISSFTGILIKQVSHDWNIEVQIYIHTYTKSILSIKS